MERWNGPNDLHEGTCSIAAPLALRTRFGSTVVKNAEGVLDPWNVEAAEPHGASVRCLDHGLDRHRAADPQFPHRIGHTDALALEGVPQRQHHVALDVVEPIGIA